jgi:hypothetical protein
MMGALVAGAAGSKVIPPRMTVRLLIEDMQKEPIPTELWQYAFDPKAHSALTPLSRDEQLQALKGLRRADLQFDKDEYADDDKGPRFVIKLVAPRTLEFEMQHVELSGEIGPPWKYVVIAVRKTGTAVPLAKPDKSRTVGKKPSMADWVGEYPLDLERSKGLVDHPNILKDVRLIIRPDLNIEWGGGKRNDLTLVKDLDANGIAFYSRSEGLPGNQQLVILDPAGYIEINDYFFKVKPPFTPPEPVTGDEAAVALARVWLKAQSQADQYILNDPKASQTTNEWRVYFRHVNWQNQKPSTGLVIVDKISGKARWGVQE